MHVKYTASETCWPDLHRGSHGLLLPSEQVADRSALKVSLLLLLLVVVLLPC